MLAMGNSMQVDLHTPRLPYVLTIYSLRPFVCNALFLFLLLYFHMYKPQINRVNVCTQLISLRNEHFLGDTFHVLCFHMYKCNIGRTGGKKKVFSYVQTPDIL